MAEPIVVELSNGDKVSIRGVVTRALDKEFTKRKYKNIKFVRDATGALGIDSFDMTDNEEVNDFIVLSMIEKVIQTHGVELNSVDETYIVNLNKIDFNKLLETSISVISPKTAKEAEKEKKA